MRVCDICKEQLRSTNRVTIEGGFVSYGYEVCRKCAKKITRCIKYMELFNEKRGAEK